MPHPILNSFTILPSLSHKKVILQKINKLRIDLRKWLLNYQS